MSPQFTKQASRPMSPLAYQAAARMLRRIADDIDLETLPASPQEKRRLTRLIHSLARSVKVLRARHDKLINQEDQR